MLIEDEILRREDSLGAYVVGIHALPAARNGRTVEYYKQPIVGRIGEDLLIETHGLLLIAAEEIDLDAFDTDGLHPSHLLFADDGAIHAVDGSLNDVVPVAGRRIPENNVDTLSLGVFDEIGDTVIADVEIPPVIDKDILETEGLGEIDVCFLVVVVDAGVLP